jgi:hypothetical protein
MRRTFVVTSREVVASPGSFDVVPRGVEHTAHITRPLRGPLIYTPGDAVHHCGDSRGDWYG